ncbi:MAG TPA: low molecular weight phosphatase family protein [Nitrososphaeria archaeon]|nr:low molecular weight phosphatase family protein [Nitrososphaeria archaeon]
MVRILFLCVGNMFRSQVAESFAKHYGGYLVEAMSAGTWLESFSEAERRERLLRAAEILGISLEGKSERQLVEEFRKKAMELNKEVLEDLRKRINFSLRTPRKLEPWMLNWADIIVALCPEAASACPRNLVKDKKLIVWNVEDPFNKPPSKVKEIVDEIERNVKKLIKEVASFQKRA